MAQTLIGRRYVRLQWQIQKFGLGDAGALINTIIFSLSSPSSPASTSHLKSSCCNLPQLVSVDSGRQVSFTEFHD